MLHDGQIYDLSPLNIDIVPGKESDKSTSYNCYPAINMLPFCHHLLRLGKKERETLVDELQNNKLINCIVEETFRMEERHELQL